jgi:protoporphyrinogen oxidase
MSGAGRILIVGGGPAGLGAAWRLHESGHADWQLLEKEDHVGGLAASHVDENGFTWDLGGHVVFSHYEYFDGLLDRLLKDQWVRHERQAWVWMRERFIPYPLQNNIRHLPTPELIECLEGLLDAQKAQENCGLGPSDSIRNPQSAVRNRAPHPPTFADWIVRRFGAGLARVFLNPYNLKVWATDPARMSSSWVGERVATVDLKRVLRHVIEGRDDLGWGPNATFRFPLHGGTGRIWQALAERLPAGHLRLATEVTAIDGRKKIAHLSDGTTMPYDWLVTTMPLDHLLGRILEFVGWAVPTIMGPDRDGSVGTAHPTSLCYSSTHVIGVGLAGPAPERLATKCWMYFPEPQLPFYRVTVFSNYSPHNVPHPGRQWSLIAEVSESVDKPVDRAGVVGQTIDGLKAARLIEPQAAIETIWHRRLEHGYPTPFLGRDAVLDRIEPDLRSMNILSRGRFGAWKYEVGNMDHSFMQGVEAANHILLGEPETTLRSPAVVNARKPSGGKGI